MKIILSIARWTAVTLLSVFLLLFLGAGFLFWRAHDALPQTEGELVAQGLDAPVSIIRDRHGVPHIEAQTAHDANYAMGFVHAQDRLWQMHVTRWYLRGQFASVLGAIAADSDAQLRTYGLGDAADALASSLTPAELAPLQAYADGVNAAMESDGFTPPLEFLMLGVAPEPWTAADVALTYKGLAFDLINGGAFRAVGRARLASILGADRMAEFLPPYPANGPFALSADELGLTPAETPAALPTESAPAGGPIEGSNNWVVSGAHTASGLPLLANDPHLGLRAPGVWYLAAVETADGAAVGASVPGAPSIVLGRNDRIAWGFTNTATDVADLAFVPESAVIETREISIPVRFGKPRITTVRRTTEGPVLDAPLFPEGTLAPAGQVAVLRWNLDDPEDRTATVGAALNAARDWPSFEAAMTRFYTPMQNMVFADVDGNIGFIAPGHVPVRGPDGGWTGAIPFAELPRVLNPADGMIVSANNRIVPPEYPHFLTDVWAEPYRAQRITDLLGRSGRHTPESFAAIQQDALDLSALVILTALLDAEPQTVLGRTAFDRLQRWNGDMSDSAEALIYAAFMKEMARAIYADELGDAFESFTASRTPFMQSVIAGPNGHWCDVTTTDTVETCVQIAGSAFDKAVAAIEAEYGSDIDDWRWGKAHAAYFGHAPFSALPLMDSIFSARAPLPGDANTVNVGAFSYAQDGFETTHAASFRAIYDLSDLDASLFAMPMGQSGHIASPHYKNLLQPWARGEYFQIRTDLTADSPDARALTLTPATTQ